MPTEQDGLRKKVEIKMIWLTHTESPNVEKQVIDCILDLIKDECAQLLDRVEQDVIGKDTPIIGVMARMDIESAGKNKLRARQRKAISKLREGTK